MKKMYWKSHNLPRYLVITLCLIAILGMMVVEYNKKVVHQKYYRQKVAAALLAKRAFSAVKYLRLSKAIPINLGDDPQVSGLIGNRLTSITTDQGVLSAKQTTINPNIAAIFVSWLKELGLKKGDTVALGATGSFPALDISMLAAIKTLGLKPLLVYSAGASQYGANIPGFSWLDIQHELTQKGIFHYKVLGVSLGGSQDIAARMSSEGVNVLSDTIKQYDLHFLNSKGTSDGIEKRMQLYKQAAGKQPIKAYVNIGGGMASIGLKRIGKSPLKNDNKLEVHSLRTGVIKSMPISLVKVDSVAVRFLKKGVPVINVHNIAKKLVNQYQLPTSPRLAPRIGRGDIFYHKVYNNWLAFFSLLIIVVVLLVMSIVSRKYMIRFIR